ncbi:ImmA/IrrE family metallo-endopeptidase [Bacillus sp. 165]|uniref:ImmA/IrrE family metallo-endopeptidase n=1 Tax=Bacillus sp. 165 TaxID=1529117 RepID=UPI001ADA335A|nr:ImmA/IrrE family metallo-endopeptidase [Bacillus sp. 165]MBO9128946.1 hypothetical protein [Bacillus sp. 165]
MDRFKQNQELSKSGHALPSVYASVFAIRGCNFTDREIKNQFTLASQIWKINFIIQDIIVLDHYSVPTGDNSYHNRQSREVQRLFDKRIRMSPNIATVGVFYSNARVLSNNATGRAFPAPINKTSVYNIILTKSARENTLAHELGHILFHSNLDLQGKNPDPNSNGNHSKDSNNIMHGNANPNKRNTTSLQRLKALESTLVKYQRS